MARGRNGRYQEYTKEELINEIERLKKYKEYGIVWDKNQTEKVVKQCKNELPVLREVKCREIRTDPCDPVNLLIEGDNYHSLSVLNYTHAKSIDVIYIDPPFNTGNRDFIFNDKYVDVEDGYIHSKWLSFMNKRLRLAKDLLKPTGLIFISINDIECAQLRLLCDNEIFGRSNFVAQLIWKTRQNVDSRSVTGASIDHEYILVYRRSDKARLKGREIDKSKYTNPDNDPRGAWMSSPIDGLATKERRPNLHYIIVDPETGRQYKPSPEAGWRFERATVKRMIKEKRLIFPKNPLSKPRMKRYLNELKNKYTGFSSILDADFTSFGTKELRQITGREAFKFPKPTTLIEQLINQHKNKNAVVLDFMAGSGTTGQAVLQLNRKDGGNRKFILCTNNENNICTNVCHPRIKKVIEGYENSKGENVEGLGGNLKYFKTDFVDAEPTDKNKMKLTERATEMLCVKEGTFEPVVDNERFKIFKNSDHYTGIIWDQTAIPKFKKKIEGIKGKFSIYVFSLEDETFDDEFKDVKQKIRLSPVPEAILKVYRRIFR